MCTVRNENVDVVAVINDDENQAEAQPDQRLQPNGRRWNHSSPSTIIKRESLDPGNRRTWFNWHLVFPQWQH